MNPAFIGYSLLFLSFILAFCGYKMIIGAIKSAQFHHEEALWVWNKKDAEIVIFHPHEPVSKIPNVNNPIQAKEIMKDKDLKYVGDVKYLQKKNKHGELKIKR